MRAAPSVATFVPVALALATLTVAAHPPQQPFEFDGGDWVVLHAGGVAARHGWVVAANDLHVQTHNTSSNRRPGDSLTVDRVLVALSRSPLQRKRLSHTLLAVSTPGSPRFREHLGFDEANALTAPSATCRSSVERWLGGRRQQQHSGNSPSGSPSGDSALHWSWLASGDYIELQNVTSSHVARLFGPGSELRAFEQRLPLRGGKGGTAARRIGIAGPIYVPRNVRPCVDVVSGLHSFPSESEMRQWPAASRIPLRARGGLTRAGIPAVTPALLKAQYNVTGHTPAHVGIAGAQAIAQFQDQSFSPQDLKSFFSKFVPRAKNASDWTVSKIVGSNEASQPTGESSLDTQYIMSMVEGEGVEVQTWVWGTPGSYFCQDLMSWVASVASTADAPVVHSVSYGLQSGMDPCYDSRSRLDEDFQKLGARGISILVASGDDGSGRTGGHNPKLYPAWPASSPWVTSVGATRFLDNARAPGPEAAPVADYFLSGGGFSWSDTRPAYQEDAVKRYLDDYSQDLPPQNMFHKSGRGTPDVAALGMNFQIIVEGQTEGVVGTSASTPTFAGMVSLLNAALQQKELQATGEAQKKTLGFLNPWLYKNQEMFWDVTDGNNQIMGDGYTCQPGWDAVTGLGTLNWKVAVQKL